MVTKDAIRLPSPPWERCDGEPYVWFHRFYNFFRPQGPGRTIEEAYRWFKDTEAPYLKNARPSMAWYDRAREWKWRERALAWDEEERRHRMVAEEEARSEANQRFIEHARMMQRLAMAKLASIETEESLEDMRPDDARKMVESGVKIEREALGMPTWMVKLVAMDDDELAKEYSNLLAQIGGYRTDGQDAGAGSDRGDDDSDEF